MTRLMDGWMDEWMMDEENTDESMNEETHIDGQSFRFS